MFDAFVKFVADGGGLVVFHSSVAPFEDSKAFNEMIGMGWRKADFGKRLTIDDSGKQVVTPAGEGPGAGHGPAHPYEIVIRDGDHPVTKGLPKKFMHMKDELYHGMRGPLTNIHVLATAWSDPNFKGTGTNEPMVWTSSYGKGRVLVDLLGHEGVNTTAPSSAVFIERGLQWAATGKVTIPAPKGLGTEK